MAATTRFSSITSAVASHVLSARRTPTSPPDTPNAIIVKSDAIEFIPPDRQRALTGHSTQDDQALPASKAMWMANFGPYGRHELGVIVEYATAPH
jgi:hypothetical protein